MRKVAYANVTLKGTTTGTTADGDGFFYIRTLERSDSLIVTYIGYPRLAIKIEKGKSQVVNVDMAIGGHELKEITVKKKRGRRHPVDTPAVYVYRQVLAHKKQNREDNLPDYKLQEYQKLQIGIMNPKKVAGQYAPAATFPLCI
jgi:hypothetical protein